MQTPIFKQVLIDKIRINNRLRPVSERHVETLIESIKLSGFNTVIKLWQEPGEEDPLLADGRHRLEAAKRIGMVEIPAFITPATQENYSLVLEEATLNLARNDLNPYDRAASVAAVYETLLIKAGVAKGESARKLGAEARWKQAHKMQGYENTQVSIRDDAAKLCGLGLENFKKLVGMYRNLLPDLAEAMRQKPEFELSSFLIELSRYPTDFQAKLIEYLNKNPSVSVRDAINELTSDATKPDVVSKDGTQAYLSKFVRLAAENQENLLPKLFAGIRPIARGEAMVTMAKELNVEQKRGLLSALADDLNLKIEGEV